MDTTGRVREVYAMSYRRLVGQLTGVTGDPVEAEDVVMEAFARAVTKSRALTPRLVDRSSYDDLSADRLALLAALRTLPTGQREAIALHHLADLPVHEVATTLGVPVGTVKAWLSRGRARLAVLLDVTLDQEEERHV